MEQDVITMHDIFVFERSSINELGKVCGRFKATGIRPRCSQQMAAAGIQLPMEMFDHVALVA
jgi:pilus assembly protein CpaF